MQFLAGMLSFHFTGAKPGCGHLANKEILQIWLFRAKKGCSKYPTKTSSNDILPSICESLSIATIQSPWPTVYLAQLVTDQHTHTHSHWGEDTY